MRQQRVQLAFARCAFLPNAFELEIQDAQLCLRLDHVLLRRLTDRVALLADLEERAEQIAVPSQDVAHRVGVGQPVVGLLDARRDAEARPFNLLGFRVGLA